MKKMIEIAGAPSVAWQVDQGVLGRHSIVYGDGAGEFDYEIVFIWLT